VHALAQFEIITDLFIEAAQVPPVQVPPVLVPPAQPLVLRELIRCASSFDLVLISLSQDLQCSLVDFSRSQHNIVSSNGRAVPIHTNMVQYDIYFNNLK
jgi:hypothetical protein